MNKIVWPVLIFISFAASAQDTFFQEPLKIPLLLTGTFAELRSNHFHSGIDIRTEGKTGLPVYPAAEGFVSRIVVSPSGFGNALYIDHPNGTTTVYGHLGKFKDEIAGYVKNIQYKNKSFRIDVAVPPGKFPVKKDEAIALSGNSGSSGGPHLHFEIRDTKTQEPLNPLNYGLSIQDDMNPKITGLRIYPLNNESHVAFLPEPKNYDVVFYSGKYHIRNNPEIPVYGKVGFGIEAIDYLNGTWSKCGISYLSIKVDGHEIFGFELNRFSFSQTRYLNSHIDFAEYIDNHRRFYKTWKDPGNMLPFYHTVNNDGSFVATGQKRHTVEVTVSDSYKNTSTLVFKIKSSYRELPSKKTKGFQTFYYNRDNYFEANGIKASCPVGAFYADFEFDYNVITNNDTTLFSDIHEVHHNTTPVHDPITLSIKPDNLPDGLKDKSLIVALNENLNHKSAIGGEFVNGYVTARARSFGIFAVAIDTVAPSLTPLSIRNKRTLVEQGQIRFRIKDELSGIKNYTGTIDGEWVLFEYDAKNNLLCYTFDEERMQFNQNHQLKLTATDNKGNTATYEAAFFK